jgi:hypothetical protein
MSKRLPVPPELEHLIEKREQEKDRRVGDERSKSDRRNADLGPLGAIESAADIDDVPTADRRSGEPRRQQKDRRKKQRRKGT